MALSASTLRSDSLATLRPLVGPDGLFKMFEGIFQTTFILDANIVLGEVRWLTFKRKSNDARSDLRELLESKTILAIAPSFLKEEMELNLRRMATQHGVAVSILVDHWQALQPLITFMDTGGADSAFMDPKDAPYIKLQRQSGHLIYSRDKDILKMGGETATPAMVASLRIYSRHAVIEYTLKAGGAGAIHLSFGFVVSVFRLARSIAPNARRIPRKIWFTLVLLIACAFLYRPTRQYLVNVLQSISLKSKALGKNVIEQFELSWREHEEAKRTAESALAALQ